MRQHFGGTVVLDERLRAARHASDFRLAKASGGIVPTNAWPLILIHSALSYCWRGEA